VWFPHFCVQAEHSHHRTKTKIQGRARVEVQKCNRKASGRTRKQLNKKTIWVGQTTSNPRAIGVAVRVLKCIYVNARSVLNKTEELCTEVQVIDADIIVVSGSWANDSISDREF